MTKVKRGVSQGWFLIPYLLNLFIEKTIDMY